MTKQYLLPRITLWTTRVVALIVVILMFCLPALLDWYCSTRNLTVLTQYTILIDFYCCCLVLFPAFWLMDKLLRNILSGQVFTRKNVRIISSLRWCCGGISLICLPAACIYYPLIFMVVIMAFLCLMVSVLVQVMDSAVTIREENDLTI